MPRRDQEPIPQTPDSSDDENERQAAEPTFVFEYRLTNIERVLKSRTGLFRTFRGCLIAFWYRKQVKALVALLDGLESRNNWAGIKRYIRLRFTVTEKTQGGTVFLIREVNGKDEDVKKHDTPCYINKQFLERLRPMVVV
ncbi:hypothetical protein J4E86_005249 [Alternaria arbusti]|uniref:uncharacterized protein n=1 Tax=Alternaria arbusti TaxID=232088 RepID=UPI00221FB40C|nr:uncharacterized protein J4E86_005249 [Alternaria arbusti]KAI4956778.1 hypothetical protein J4E86_005249 [Alternaria arbusti]